MQADATHRPSGSGTARASMTPTFRRATAQPTLMLTYRAAALLRAHPDFDALAQTYLMRKCVVNRPVPRQPPRPIFVATDAPTAWSPSRTAALAARIENRRIETFKRLSAPRTPAAR
jgi:hypothetical protein